MIYPATSRLIQDYPGLIKPCVWLQFGPAARVEVSFNDGFRFFDDMYADVLKYRGTKFKFTKHFMGPDEVPAFDGKDGGEEEQCALVIDSLPGLRYWTRNVMRHRNSFSLPTSTDKFYADFCEPACKIDPVTG